MNGTRRSIMVAWLVGLVLCGMAGAGTYPHKRDGMVYGLYAGWGWTTLSATDITQDPPLERESDTARPLESPLSFSAVGAGSVIRRSATRGSRVRRNSRSSAAQALSARTSLSQVRLPCAV